MVLNDHTVEGAASVSDRRIVRWRNRLGVKKVARVVEFEVTSGFGLLCDCLAQRRPEHVVDLFRDGSWRCGCGERVLPQIAHGAANRALGRGEKDRHAGGGSTGEIRFGFSNRREGDFNGEGVTLHGETEVKGRVCLWQRLPASGRGITGEKSTPPIKMTVMLERHESLTIYASRVFR